MPSAYRFRVTGGGTYDALRPADDVYLGRVVKAAESFNGSLHTYWRAYPAATPHHAIKDGGGQVSARFATREKAAMALEDVVNGKGD